MRTHANTYAFIDRESDSAGSYVIYFNFKGKTGCRGGYRNSRKRGPKKLRRERTPPPPFPHSPAHALYEKVFLSSLSRLFYKIQKTPVTLNVSLVFLKSSELIIIIFIFDVHYTFNFLYVTYIYQGKMLKG